MSENYGAWYKSFLNRDITPDEWNHWDSVLNQTGDKNATLDQFLQSAQQERPRDSLTDHQRDVWDKVATAYKSPDTDYFKQLLGHTPTSYEELSQPLYDSFTDTENLGKAGFDAKFKAIWDKGGAPALQAALNGDAKNQDLLEMQAANRKPNGSDDSFFSFLKEGLPIAGLPFLAGAAVGGLGSLGAGAGAGATAAGGAATGAGGVAAGGLGGSLSSAWAALPSAAQSALTSMGVKGAVNLATGQPLGSGLLQAGLMSGLGSIGSNFVGPYVGQGLTNLGFSPETVSGLIKPVTTGIVGTGAGLIKGQGLGKALLNGMQSGTISYAGDKLNGLLSGSGLSQPTQNILGGAGRGAIGSVIRGKNPLAGIVGGATQGAFNYGAGMLSPISKPEVSSPSKADMSGESDDDYFSVDGTDWLKQIENDYSDPYGFRNNDFTNYGDNNYEPYTMNDSYSDAYPDLMNGADAPDTGNSALDNFLKQLGGGLGNAAGAAVGGGSGGNSFVDKLMKQFGGLGDKAAQNPLAAIAAAMGAAGTLRNAFGGAPNNLAAVDALMAKGQQQMNTPAVLPHGNIVARDPRLFMQQYAADNTPTAAPQPASPDYHNQLSTLYQSVLGRAPDAAGEQYWNQQMKNGMSLTDVLKQLEQSPEHSPQAQLIMTGGLSKVQP